MLFQNVLQPVPVNIILEKQKLGRLKTTSLIVKFIAQSTHLNQPQQQGINSFLLMLQLREEVQQHVQVSLNKGKYFSLAKEGRIKAGLPESAGR